MKQKFLIASLVLFAISPAFSVTKEADQNIIVNFEGEVADGSCAVKLAGMANSTLDLGKVSNNKGKILPIVFEFSDCIGSDNRGVTIKLSKINLRNGAGNSAELNVAESRNVWVSLLKNSVGDLKFDHNKDVIARTSIKDKSFQVGGIWAQLQSRKGARGNSFTSKGYFAVEYD